MIDEEKTFETYGYTSGELKPKSGKRVVAICGECGIRRDLKFQDYHKLCQKCTSSSDATRKRISESKSGEKNPMYGKHHSEESRKKTSESTSGEKHYAYGAHQSEETKRRHSATKQGIAYEDWESYARNSPYCPAFNEECRESNRDKYNRRCFICGLPESENTCSTGRHKKLYVHHADMNKLQGCNGIRWKLVPVCIHCHIPLHNELWKSRIIYLLNTVWNCD